MNRPGSGFPTCFLIFVTKPESIDFIVNEHVALATTALVESKILGKYSKKLLSQRRKEAYKIGYRYSGNILS